MRYKVICDLKLSKGDLIQNDINFIFYFNLLVKTFLKFPVLHYYVTIAVRCNQTLQLFDNNFLCYL